MLRCPTCIEAMAIRRVIHDRSRGIPISQVVSLPQRRLFCPSSGCSERRFPARDSATREQTLYEHRLVGYFARRLSFFFSDCPAFSV